MSALQWDIGILGILSTLAGIGSYMKRFNILSEGYSLILFWILLVGCFVLSILFANSLYNGKITTFIMWFVILWVLLSLGLALPLYLIVKK